MKTNCKIINTFLSTIKDKFRIQNFSPLLISSSLSLIPLTTVTHFVIFTYTRLAYSVFAVDKQFVDKFFSPFWLIKIKQQIRKYLLFLHQWQYLKIIIKRLKLIICNQGISYHTLSTFLFHFTMSMLKVGGHATNSPHILQNDSWDITKYTRKVWTQKVN